MSNNNYGKRFLAQHNPGTSPQTKTNKASSPQTTPTKFGDRYIPIRNSEDQQDGWWLRFAKLHSPQTQPAASAAASSTGNNHNVVRRLVAGGAATGASPNQTSGNQQSHSGGNVAAAQRPQQQTQSEDNGSLREDVIAHRALLSNELLRSGFNDIRQSVSAYNAMPVPNVKGNGANGSGGINNTPHKMPQPAIHSTQSSPGLFHYNNSPSQLTTPTKRNRHHSGAEHDFNDTASSSQCSQSEPPHSNVGRNVVLNHKQGAVRSPAVRNLSTAYSLTPLSQNSQLLLRSPRKPMRKVPKNPYKVLDAPELQDDFYLNLVDWSSQNMLAVGLSHCVYLWSASNSQVHKLCDLSTDGDGDDMVSSVQWSEKGDLLAVGTNKGYLHIWDAVAQKKVHNFSGHTFRIGCAAWNQDTVCTGSRDRMIIQRDLRQSTNENGGIVRRLNAHKQEVCGLKWSPDHQSLASGGNDNNLLIWSLHRETPVLTFDAHDAAVKALAWCPHQHGLLVSGGGTADRCLRFWNTLTGQPMQYIDTGSQVCNVAWSKHTKELVSTHGYSQNHIVIWKYPSLQQVAKLTGHSYRVLYLATSPDGESIVTGAGDETLRFWHVFNKQRVVKEARSQLNFYTSIR